MKSHILTRILFLGLLVWTGLAERALAQEGDPVLAAAQQAVEEAQTADEEIVALLNYARLLNTADRYQEALDVISEATQTVGLPSAVEIRPASVTHDSEQTRLILLTRGVAHEGLGQFAEARNDYLAFLSLESASPTASALYSRLGYINTQATANMAMLARFEEGDLAQLHNQEASRYRVGVFPFFNVSDQLLLNFVAYGVSGFLANAVSLLEQFTNQPIRASERSRLNAALKEVSVGRYYSDESPIPPPQIARVLGAELAVMGTVDLGDNGVGLAVTPQIGHTATDSVYTLDPVAGSSFPEGVQQMQRDLALNVADQLQDLIGFEYTPSREAYADSVDGIVIEDLQRFVNYGRSVELGILGDFDVAAQVLNDADVVIAALDAQRLAEARLAAQPPQPDLAQWKRFLANRAQSSLATVDREPPTDTEPDTEPGQEDDTPPVPTPRRQTAAALVGPATMAQILNMTGQAALGAAAVSDAVTGASASSRKTNSEDPRDGVEGVKRTQTGQVNLQIVIPVPPPSSTATKTSGQ